MDSLLDQSSLSHCQQTFYLDFLEKQMDAGADPPPLTSLKISTGGRHSEIITSAHLKMAAQQKCTISGTLLTQLGMVNSAQFWRFYCETLRKLWKLMNILKS